MKKKLSDIGELGLIRMFQKKCPVKSRDILRGIGDDAATFRIREKIMLASSDLMLEGIHFDLSYSTFYQLGHKLLAINVSDIFAMGGVPRYVLINLGMPEHAKSEDVRELYDGIMDGARTFKVAVIGGDTSASETGFMLSATVIGDTVRPITRSGARPGDGIYVTGFTGDSAMGLLLLGKLGKRSLARLRKQQMITNDKILKIDKKAFHLEDILYLTGKHLLPEPNPIRNTDGITAMIDVSDGLLMDVSHICDESNVGALIYHDRLPVSRELSRVADAMNIDPVSLALSGGEDYILLFTGLPAKKKKNAVRIGEITAKGRYLVDERGKKRAFRARGYEHFKLKIKDKR